MKNKIYKSGVLLHPTALPGDWGIGELGDHAYKFIDDLVEMGQSYWQILPLGPLDNSHSPYSSLSTFAGNPLIISFDSLIKIKLLKANEIPDFENLNKSRISFDETIVKRMRVFEIVCSNFNERANERLKKEFTIFCEENIDWLEDYSKFCALKKANKNLSWNYWDPTIKANDRYIQYEKILQFLFFMQWNDLKSYCNAKGIEIIGDMPIYVSYDSVDVWANPELFQLDQKGNKIAEAGCPPCAFHHKGQVWGNPLYDWEAHKKSKFNWWLCRFKKLFDMVDIIRLDHFIGFLRYWKLPANSTSADNGYWVKVPGDSLFDALLKHFKSPRIIAEDLGDINDEVINLREKYSFPGMKVIQFESINSIESTELYNYNSVTYTGTHDNNTTKGWLDEMNNEKKKYLEKKVCSVEVDMNWSLIDRAMHSGSQITIVPIQDILGLDKGSRFNVPGTLSKLNWSWRLKENQLQEPVKEKYKRLTNKSGRLARPSLEKIKTTF